jgi:hypothetical protein
VPLADTNEGFSRLASGTSNAIKILVEPGA